MARMARMAPPLWRGKVSPFEATLTQKLLGEDCLLWQVGSVVPCCQRRGHGGIANHQFRAHLVTRDAPLAVFQARIDSFHDNARGQVSHGLQRLPNRGQGRSRHGGKRHVIKAHHRAVFRHFHAGLGQRANDAQCSQIVKCHHRRELLFALQQFFRQPVAALESGIGVLDIRQLHHH